MRNTYSFSADKFKGDWGNTQKKHLLDRVMFGCTRKDLAFFATKSFDQTIDQLIAESPIPSPPVNYYQSKVEDPHGIKLGETWVNATYGNGTVNFSRRQSLRYWWIQQMWNQPYTIHEKMTLFWHNHFATQIEVYDSALAAFSYHNTLRKHALGNFKALTKAITIEPAMLEYLNGQQSSAESPDENYARELQELFTLGKGENSKYTEEDVRQAAKVLTGHRYTGDTFKYLYRSSKHDSTDKKFSAFYKNRVIKGRTGEPGAEELDDLLNMIFENEEVSLFLVRKLYRFFIYYEISAAIESNFIVPLAKVFRDNNYETKPLLKAFFSSEHFFDKGNYGAIISSPIDYIIKTLRHLEPSIPSLSENVYTNYSVTGVYMRVCETCQQYLGDPPSVAGWPAYYQTPLFHEIWINSDTYQKRNQSILTLLSNNVRREGYQVVVDVIAYASGLSAPENPVQLIDDLCKYFLAVQIDATQKTKIKKDILLSGQSNDFYWTELWNSYLQKPTNKDIKNMVDLRLRALFIYLMSLPEYQLS